MKIKFIQLTKPTPEIVNAFNKWDNDPLLKPLMRPNRTQADIDTQTLVTLGSLTLYLFWVWKTLRKCKGFLC